MQYPTCKVTKCTFQNKIQQFWRLFLFFQNKNDVHHSYIWVYIHAKHQENLRQIWGMAPDGLTDGLTNMDDSNIPFSEQLEDNTYIYIMSLFEASIKSIFHK